MQTSVIRYPKCDRYIRVHESILTACQNNACAAALVSYLEGWHNYKQQQQEYLNDLALENGRPILDDSGWQYHTQEQLKRGIMIYKTDSINAAIKLLEELDFISTDPPERLRLLHKTGRTRWFLLRAEKINDYLEGYIAERMAHKKPLVFPRPPKPVIEDKPKSASADNAQAVFDYRNKRRIAHFKTKGKRVLNQQMTWEELTPIILLLDRGFSVEQLCYAVEGLYANDWYMGNNDRNTVYDSVRHIFKDAAQVNKHIAYAEQQGIPFGTEQVSGAPDDVALKAYHWKLAKIVRTYVIDDVGMRSYAVQVENHIDRSLPLRPPLVRDMIESICVEEAGMLLDAHGVKITEALTKLEEIYEREN